MIFFCHIPKAGGETIKELIYRSYGYLNCFKIGVDFFEPHSFFKVPRETLISKKAIVGHLTTQDLIANPYIGELISRNSLKSFSVVRDPLDRVISEYNFIRQSKNHPIHEVLLSSSLQDYANSIGNVQRWSLIPNLNSSLEEIFDFHALFKLPDSIRKVGLFLENYLGRKVDSANILPANKTEDLEVIAPLVRRSDLSEDFVNAFYCKNSIDKEIYERAV